MDKICSAKTAISTRHLLAVSGQPLWRTAMTAADRLLVAVSRPSAKAIGSHDAERGRPYRFWPRIATTRSSTSAHVHCALRLVLFFVAGSPHFKCTMRYQAHEDLEKYIKCPPAERVCDSAYTSASGTCTVHHTVPYGTAKRDVVRYGTSISRPRAKARENRSWPFRKPYTCTVLRTDGAVVPPVYCRPLLLLPNLDSNPDLPL